MGRHRQLRASSRKSDSRPASSSILLLLPSPAGDGVQVRWRQRSGPQQSSPFAPRQVIALLRLRRRGRQTRAPLAISSSQPSRVTSEEHPPQRDPTFLFLASCSRPRVFRQRSEWSSHRQGVSAAAGCYSALFLSPATTYEAHRAKRHRCSSSGRTLALGRLPLGSRWPRRARGGVYEERSSPLRVPQGGEKVLCSRSRSSWRPLSPVDSRQPSPLDSP